MSTSLDADVVIVGYGPVGQTLAPLLAVRVIAWPCTSVEERGIDFAGCVQPMLCGPSVISTGEVAINCSSTMICESN